MIHQNQSPSTLLKKGISILGLLLTSASLSSYLPAALLLSASTVTIAQVAKAEESAPVTLIQAFGWDATEAAYKVLIQSNSGRQYYVWYYDLIGARVGSVIQLTYTGSGSSMYMNKLINPGNGKESTVKRYHRVN
ncbi:hypothetical protein ACKFKG_22055 [Phormidesmis sp. 146-35]